MDMKLELVPVPVTDIDRAKAFYVDQVGFVADHDIPVDADLRFVQLTPPGSACSIVLDVNMTSMPPGAQQGLQVVVDDARSLVYLAQQACLTLAAAEDPNGTG